MIATITSVGILGLFFSGSGSCFVDFLEGFGGIVLSILKAIIEDYKSINIALQDSSIESLTLSIQIIILCNGESSPGARPVMQEWVIDIRDQCLRVKVPFFFKQWGGVQKKRAGRTLEGRILRG